MTIFRLEAEGKYVDFSASTEAELFKAVIMAGRMLWNDLHPEEVERRVASERERLLKKYGSAKGLVEALMGE